MGACNSLFTKHHDKDDKDSRMLQAEIARLQELVSALEMQLYQQRSEVDRMTYIAERERKVASHYKDRFWRLTFGDLLATRRLHSGRSA